MSVQYQGERPELPYVMKAKLQNKILAAVIFPMGLSLLWLFVYLSIDAIHTKEHISILGILITLIVFSPFLLFLNVWPILAITCVTCAEQDVEFSACFITYSRVRWEDITKVKVQTVDYRIVADVLRSRTITMSSPVVYKTINLFHKRSFLGFASALGIANYRVEDLMAFGIVLKEKTGLSFDQKG